MSNQPSFSDRIAVWLATGLGLGCSPVMPGTVGALWGIPIAIGIYALPGTLSHAALLLLLAIIGIPLCDRAARALGKEDPGAVVWDEFTTVPLAYFLLDAELVCNPWVLATGFLLHRVFDISKIPPANRCERMHGGLGIMADDWVAGAYACASLHVIVWWGAFS